MGPTVPGNGLSEGSNAGLSVPWKEAVRGLTGTKTPKNIPDDEVAAVYGLVGELRADLAAPATASDEGTLASIARLQLLEWRLSRTVFQSGAIRKNGDVRPALTELRQIMRLKSDLLARLRFRDAKSARKTLDSYLADRTQAQGAPIAPADGSEVAPAPDRVTAADAVSEGGQ